MAGATLRHRYSGKIDTVRSLALSAVLLLSTIWLVARSWLFLPIELNLLWLSDDLLSWRRLSHQPGPWFADLSSLPIVWHVWKGDFYDWLERSHKRHGSIIRE